MLVFLNINNTRENIVFRKHGQRELSNVRSDLYFINNSYKWPVLRRWSKRRITEYVFLFLYLLRDVVHVQIYLEGWIPPFQSNVSFSGKKYYKWKT